jgi:hypothetical protein
MRQFRELTGTQDPIFEDIQLSWKNSTSYKSLGPIFEELLGSRKVSKIICFGLGDMCRTAPDWLERQGESDKQNSNNRSMIQHSVALTLVDACHNTNRKGMRLIAQDPDYTVEATNILTRHGFEIVGQFGAGGFAEIDDESIVFSPFVSAPVKQIIADIARPALVISSGFETFNDRE